MDKEYKISESDIEVALRWLKYHDPKNETREQAIALLKDLKSGFHSMAHQDPDKLLELKDELSSKNQ